MADERDFELLDDYLTQRISEQDRLRFERKLEADPDLQHEYALQKRLIKGIKDARAAELKAMLNRVPVPAVGNGLGTKVLLGTVISLMIAAAGYFYLSNDGPKVEAPAVVSEQPATAQKPASKEPQTEKATPPKSRQSPVIQEKRSIETDKNQTSAGTEYSRPSLAKRPDPLQAPSGPGAGSATNAGMSVSTYPGDNRYSFHYQMADGRISLYGPFSDDNYELVSLPQDEQRELVALFYNDTFYLLSDSGLNVRPLEPLEDQDLIHKLKEFREVE